MRKILLVALALALAPAAWGQNYTATQGSGTTFGSKLVSAVNYPQQVMCDPATPSQCVAVNASGQIAISNFPASQAVTNAGTFAVQATQAGTWNIGALTSITNALPAGTNVIGHIICDSGCSSSSSPSFGSAFPSTGTPIGVSDGTNLVALKSTAYGTTPTGNALGVNAFVTNTNANGSATSANSSPVVIASDQAAVPVKGNAANGSAVSGNPNLIAGSDGTNARTVATDASGNQKVINGASKYNTIAASQSAQALTGGGGGATGDYLLHCVIVPATTSPGVVTILDNSTAIYSFPGGSSSLSNLVPFSIPVMALSTSGAWKVTTGANVSVACTGRFT